MTQVSERPVVLTDKGSFFRPWMTWTGVVLVITAISQVIASRGDEDQETRDAWLTDLVFVVVATLLFAGVAALLARRALSGDARRQDRTVIGLGALSVVLSVAWFTAAPHAMGLAAVFLASATGARERSSGARAAAVIGLVVTVGLLVFTNSTLIAEDLL